MARVDCHLLQGLVPEGGGAGDKPGSGKGFKFDDEYPEIAAAQSRRSFGSFEGCFLATINDEEERINVHRLNGGRFVEGATVRRLLDMLGDKRFEFLFEREDSNRVRVSAMDTIIHLRDWMDEDDVQSALNPTADAPLVPGFSDESGVYDRYQPRYRTKNARFDSLDELYRVHGVNDRFMAAFRDRLTVFPDPNRPPTINTDDPLLLAAAILAVVDERAADARLRDPVFLQTLITRIRTARMYSFFGMTVADFATVLATAGLPLNPSLSSARTTQNALVSDKSQTYRITSVGEAGSVQKTLTAVLRLDDGLGRLLYYREE
jgi:general secretion pathway protein K